MTVRELRSKLFEIEDQDRVITFDGQKMTVSDLRAMLFEIEEQDKEISFELVTELTTEKHTFENTYTDLYDNEKELTEEELKWFYSVVEVFNRYMKRQGFLIQITNRNHELLKGKGKEAIGLHWTTDRQDLNAEQFITIDNCFIHDCYEEKVNGTWNLHFCSLEKAIAHEIAHRFYWRHGKKHTEATESILNEFLELNEQMKAEEPKKATKTITKYYTKAWVSGWHECTKEEAERRIKKMLSEATNVDTEKQKADFIKRHYKEEVVEVEVEEQEEPQKVIGYKVYSELTDKNGNTVHRVPVARTKNKSVACSHARVWENGFPNAVYEVYSDGTEQKIY